MSIQHRAQRLHRRISSQVSAVLRLARTVSQSGLLSTGLNPRLLPVMARALRAGAVGPHLIYPFQATNIPDRLALIYGDQRLSYHQFNRLINRTASGLLAIGLKPGATVAMMVTNCLDYPVVAGALQKLGCSMVPISTHLKAREAGYIIANSDAGAIIATADKGRVIEAAVADNPKVGPSGVILVGDSPSARITLSEVQALGSPDEVLLDLRALRPRVVMYTSGTTGRPKGAERSVRSVGADVALTYIDLHDLRVGDVYYAVCPLYHAAPAAFTSLTMLLGGTLVIADRFDPAQMLADIERYRVSTAQVVPTQLIRLLDQPDEAFDKADLSSLRVVVSTAAYLSPSVKLQVLERLGPVLYEMYGATELGIVTVAKPSDLARKPASVGRVIPGVDVQLLDDAGQPVPPGQPGELYARTSIVIPGYYNNAEATQASRRDGYFSVGDVARLDDEGYLYILDRKTDMVISGGVNIYPAEIEEELLAHPAVLEAAVIGVPHPEWGESLVAYVVTRNGQAVTEQALIDWCAERLARIKKPRAVAFVDELPRNPQGKVLKRSLRELHEAGTRPAAG